MEPTLPDLPLRDIHLPAPIGWWPLAPGWWVLLVGIPLLALFCVWLWRFLRRRTVKKLALAELDAIAHSTASGREKVQQLAILLRRVMLSVYPRHEVASLVGEEWLAFLDSTASRPVFSQGVGRLLIEAPYRQEAEADWGELSTLCRDWVRQLPRSGRPKRKPARPPSAVVNPPTTAANEPGAASQAEAQPLAQNGEATAKPDDSRFAKPRSGGQGE